MRVRTLKHSIIPMLGTFYGIRHSRLLKNSLTVFCYHDVTDTPSEFSEGFRLNTLPSVFDFQVQFIKDNFNIISPDDLRNEQIPQRAALLTFDDGFKSFFTDAVPILEHHQVPAIIFLNMGPIQGETFWAGLITYLCKYRPDFFDYLDKKGLYKKDAPVFLSCSEAVVDDYLKSVGSTFQSEVSEYVGAFASTDHLNEADKKEIVYFGNHLYNHQVPLLMKNRELLNSFKKNDDAIKGFKSYRNMFAYPFGQPGSCFSDDQTNLLKKECADTVFFSSGRINYTVKNPLDRLALSSLDDTSSKIWFQIFKHRMLDLKKKLLK